MVFDIQTFKRYLVLGKILNKNVQLSRECFWSPKTNYSVLTNQQCLFILPKSFQLKYSQCAIITESLSAFSSDNSIIRAMKGSFLLMISPSNISSSYSAFQLPRMHCSITALKLTVRPLSYWEKNHQVLPTMSGVAHNFISNFK